MASPKRARKTPVQHALALARPAFLHAVVFGFFINFLGLTGPLYMMQVYDRVLSSRNLSTLISLTAILAFFFAVLAILEWVRGRVLIRAGVLFDKSVNEEVFDAVHRTNLISPTARNTQALRDIDTVREFYTGSGIIAFCDVPWIPIYVATAFLLNPLFGVFAITGILVVLLLALLNERQSRTLLENASQAAMVAQNQAAMTLRNTEVMQAMGMVGTLRDIWRRRHEDVLGWQAAASGAAGPLIALSKFTRMLLQSLTLGIGAYLVIQGGITAGTMIAASIIVGKVLSPMDMIIGQWKAFTSTRQAYGRLNGMFEALPALEEKMSLPLPAGNVIFDRLSARVPGTDRFILSGVSLSIPRGSIVGVIGPSGAGKSTLVRVLSGVWPVAGGYVRIDGSDIRDWNAPELGQHVGYLPQDIELFSGTVAQNICRFREDATEEDIIGAARLAGVHELVQGLPRGYNTLIGENGSALSGGQRQRLGLARAVFGLPPIVILDEPNSNLDFAGESSLINAVVALRDVQVTVIFITHKMSMLSQADKILLLNAGQVQAFGEREEVLAAITQVNVEKQGPNVQAVTAARMA